MKDILAAGILALVLLSGCATKSSDFAKTAGVEVDQKFALEINEKDGSKTKMKCVRTKTVGSHMVKKRCLPAEDYDRMAQKTQEKMRMMKREGQQHVFNPTR